MKTKTMPAPRRAGTTRREAERLLRQTGDDPATLILLIQLCDRIVANRGRAGRKKSTRDQ